MWEDEKLGLLHFAEAISCARSKKRENPPPTSTLFNRNALHCDTQVGGAHLVFAQSVVCKDVFIIRTSRKFKSRRDKALQLEMQYQILPAGCAHGQLF